MSPRHLVLAAILACALGTLPGADSTFKIGLICSGSTSDGGWNQLARDGVQSLATAMGAEVSCLQKVSPDKAGDEMRSFVADGYDLVIAHGYEFLNPAADVAATPGKTKFAVSGADEPKPGLVSLDYDCSQASYQAGMLAASLSKSGKLGFIGGEKIPSVQSCYRGFLSGAKAVTPGASVAETYTGWDQPEKAKAQSEALIQEGVDGIYQCVDAASLGVFQAVKEANQSQPDKPVYAYGSCADQNGNPLCARWMGGSVVIRLDKTFLTLAQSVKDGTYKPGMITENLARGTCILTINPRLIANKTVSPELQSRITDAGAKLIAGQLSAASP